MSTTRSKSIVTIAILLALLAVVSTTSLVVSQLAFSRVRANFANGNAQNDGGFQGGGGGFQGGGGNGGNFQGGGGGNGRFGGGGGGNGGNFQGGGGGNGGFGGGGGFRGGGFGGLFGATRSLGISPAVIGYVNIGLTILGILLALVCAVGVWQQKKWALNLGIVVAVLFLLTALPSFFFLGGRFFNLIRLIGPTISLVASAVIVVMGILPSVRETVA